MILLCTPEVRAECFNPTLLYVFNSIENSESNLSYHSHDYTEVKIILAGSFTYLIEDTRYVVSKGNIVVMRPGVKHLKLIEPGVQVEEFNFGLTNIQLKNLPPNFLIEPETAHIYNLPLYLPEILKCINETLTEQEKCEPYSDLIIKASILKLTAILYRGMNVNRDKSEKALLNITNSEKTNIVRSIIQYMDENYMKQISLYSIANNMYLSPVYISKIFKEETGESPINHLIRIRLTKANELLSTGNIPIKTVARSVGYEDAYYFSKLYKKYYGIPPSVEKRINAV